MFHCKLCGLKSSVEIAERGKDEDVVAWVKRIGPLCKLQHSWESEHCPAQAVDIAIPIDDNARIGDALPLGSKALSVDPKSSKLWDETK